MVYEYKSIWVKLWHHFLVYYVFCFCEGHLEMRWTVQWRNMLVGQDNMNGAVEEEPAGVFSLF